MKRVQKAWDVYLTNIDSSFIFLPTDELIGERGASNVKGHWIRKEGNCEPTQYPDEEIVNKINNNWRYVGNLFDILLELKKELGMQVYDDEM